MEKENIKEECACKDDCVCDTHNETSTCESKCDCHEKVSKKEKKNACHKKEHSEKEILKKKCEELEEKNLRAQAELINYRKRKEEETMRLLKYANEDFAKELLPIVDNFERAIAMDDANLNDELSKFLEGFKMIYCHLVSALENYEVKAIDGYNKPFDPTYHQAVMTEHVDGVEPGMVVEVLQKGYLLKDKVIRPAMVKVSE